MIDFELIEQIVRENQPEGRNLDFKSTLESDQISVDPKKQRDEFLKDISAFANTAGGMIIFGIIEKKVDNVRTGQAHELRLFSMKEIADRKKRFQGWLKTGLQPTLPGLELLELESPTTKGSGVLVARIPKSWCGPHMVRTDTLEGKFYYRTSFGCEVMDYGLLRSAFLQSEAIEEKIRKFLIDRWGKIEAAETPAKIQESVSNLVVHFVPSSALSDIQQKILFDQSDRRHLEFRSTGRHNIDGYCAYDAEAGMGGICRSYVQFFRTGIVEFVTQDILVRFEKGFVGPKTIEKHLCAIINSVRKFYQDKSIDTPVYCFIGLLKVRDKSIFTPLDWSDPLASFDRENIFLPEILVDDLSDMNASYREGMPTELPPIFIDSLDVMWQAAGALRRPEKFLG